jgi:PAS domain S-box-containing protein
LSYLKNTLRRSTSLEDNHDGEIMEENKNKNNVDNAKNLAAELTGIVDAIQRVQAVIEFTTDGIIITANDNFLKTVGYTLDEIRGKHHRMFCESSYAATSEYAEFWRRLGHGDPDSGEYKRIGKGGKEVWINASYNPIFDSSGRVCKVVKFATDITVAKLVAAENVGKMSAIGMKTFLRRWGIPLKISRANITACSAKVRMLTLTNIRRSGRSWQMVSFMLANTNESLAVEERSGLALRIIRF